ncbi:MAG: transposase [Eubacteriaceae bacterium]|nr:transposase [Eubacteriaceae bacterium]
MDETGMNTGMAKPYGWGRGRAAEHAPEAQRHKAALIPAISLESPVAPLMFEGSLNGAIFTGYAEKSLMLSLPRGACWRWAACLSTKQQGLVRPS